MLVRRSSGENVIRTGSDSQILESVRVANTCCMPREPLQWVGGESESWSIATNQYNVVLITFISLTISYTDRSGLIRDDRRTRGLTELFPENEIDVNHMLWCSQACWIVTFPSVRSSNHQLENLFEERCSSLQYSSNQSWQLMVVHRL